MYDKCEDAHVWCIHDFFGAHAVHPAKLKTYSKIGEFKEPLTIKIKINSGPKLRIHD